MRTDTHPKALPFARLIALALVALPFFGLVAQAQQKKLLLYTGDSKGTYYRKGKDMQRLAAANGMDLIFVRETNGSFDNFDRLVKLRTNDTVVAAAFMQYDLLLDKKLEYNRQGNTAADSITLVCPVGWESIHLVTRRGSKINSIHDLRKRNYRIGVGTTLEGNFHTARALQRATGNLDRWNVEKLKFEDCIVRLLNGQIDCFFFVGAAPVPKFADPSLAGELKLVPIALEEKDFESRADYESFNRRYERQWITPQEYDWLEAPVATYKVRTVCVTNNAAADPGDKVFKLAQLVAANICDLKRQPSTRTYWADAPLYFSYEEIGWLKIHPRARDAFGN